MSQQSNQPFLKLGKRIKQYREKANETLAEVSGAVEIDITTLIAIEAGKQLPSEDILLLLISHFDIEDAEAVRLWELAGYNKSNEKKLNDDQQIFMILPIDNRILYSDKTDITVNDAGVVISFKQGDSTQPIARIGMSREQASAMLKLLQEGLNPSPKLLTQPKQKTITEQSHS